MGSEFCGRQFFCLVCFVGMSNNGINVLSLFDGMSCGQIALREAGIKVNKYFASEIDKFAIQQTQHNFPDTVQPPTNYSRLVRMGLQ